MSYWIPDARWELPELLIPRKKPVGPVEIDWSKSITKGMVGCYLHNTAPTKDMLNLCNGQLDAEYTSFSGSDVELRANKHGQYFKYTGTTGDTSRHIVDEDKYDWIDMLDDDFTLYTIMTHDSDVTSGWPYILARSSDGSSGSNYSIGIKDEGGNFDAWVRVGANRTFSGVNGTADQLTHLCGNFGRGRRRIWVNGVQEANVADASSLTNSGNFGIGGHPDATHGGTRGLAGKIYLSVIWNRCLVDPEVVRMYRDPYGFLLPV